MTVFASADGCSRVLLRLEMRASQREEDARWRTADLDARERRPDGSRDAQVAKSDPNNTKSNDQRHYGERV
ncbi:MAG: hypothetical protein BroJett013_17860 [Alphaproteobacteria bacterium]|nr:MAG: hypothetical protein BroJett013_17860 [Alphaproteobacteria bacterium]